MAYETPGGEPGERFHIFPQLRERLNPGKDLTTSGEPLVVPNVRWHAPPRMALKVVVSKSKRTVTALSSQDFVPAQYPATIEGPHDPLSVGDWKIASLLPHPSFVRNAERFRNVDRAKGTVTLPPGPNNPSGLVWMGLSKEHYGIHGSPVPGAIRHESSYGCIRLTNWEAEELSHMVRRGTPASPIE
jgi:hypothetical protein